MAVETVDETTTVNGLTLQFCSAQCRAQFAASPERFLRRAAVLPTPMGEHAGAP